MENRKEFLRIKRQKHIRKTLFGTAEKPRLAVHRSLNNLSAQLIDDIKNVTIMSLSTLDKEIKKQFASGGNLKVAAHFGEVFARKAKDKGVTKIVFDRAGYLYHGRIKAFADSLRKGGLQF
ncbi:MAG TPA: 50S ribosomal protein L18 [Candidatus Omnitrophota bacterium]|nr:50S ribosomal protein L18 [Candidatus Omnitrophota bacterium]HRZ15695.1 50S ribosomal protein L18 [Candidatus Omnitrophota bacterium]